MMRFFTALALILVLSCPAVAESSSQKNLSGQSPPLESAVRAQAVRDCNDQARRFTQHLWGNMDFVIYRSCMAQRGLKE
jgi:hypothetical protein